MKRNDLSFTVVPLAHAASVSKIPSQTLEHSAKKMDRKYLLEGLLSSPTLADGCVPHPVSCLLIGCLGGSEIEALSMRNNDNVNIACEVPQLRGDCRKPFNKA